MNKIEEILTQFSICLHAVFRVIILGGGKVGSVSVVSFCVVLFLVVPFAVFLTVLVEGGDVKGLVDFLVEHKKNIN